MKSNAAKVREIARRYLKVIEWSDKDNCYIGSAPPIIGQACHGATESEVLARLSTIVEEWIGIMLRDGHPLPDGTAGKSYSGKFVVRVPPAVHQKAALKAAAKGESLNQFVAEAIAAS